MTTHQSVFFHKSDIENFVINRIMKLVFTQEGEGEN